MAVAIVQEAHVYEFDASVIVTLSAVTAGNLLLAWCVNNAANAANAPDGGGWTEVPSSAITHSNSTNMDGRWYYKTAAGGETSVTLQHAGSTNLGLQVYELSGAGTPDTAVTSQVTGNTALASGSVTGTSDGMVFAGFMGAGLPGASRSYSNSYVDDVAANDRIQCAHRTVAGSTSTTLTTTNSNDKISSIFNVPAAAAATVHPPRGFPRGHLRGQRK